MLWSRARVHGSFEKVNSFNACQGVYYQVYESYTHVLLDCRILCISPQWQNEEQSWQVVQTDTRNAWCRFVQINLDGPNSSEDVGDMTALERIDGNKEQHERVQ